MSSLVSGLANMSSSSNPLGNKKRLLGTDTLRSINILIFYLNYETAYIPEWCFGIHVVTR